VNFKKTASFSHLWLGLLSGLVVFISLTAASVFVWQEELTNWYYHDAVYVKAVGGHKKPVSELLNAARRVVKDGPVGYVSISNDPRKAYVFSAYKESAVKGWTFDSRSEYEYKIYVDQYTGKVIGLIDTRYDWINCMYIIHICLYLNYDFGHYVVGGATLIIFVMALTGIVLWWPKNKPAFKQRIWFRWKKTTKWRRKNYDLHNIGGIYTWIFILFFAATGLVWTFDWWTNGIYRLLGDDSAKLFAETPKPRQGVSKRAGLYEYILQDGAERVPAWQNLQLSFEEQETDTAQIVYNIVRYNSGSGWDEWDEYAYNSKSGEMYHALTQSQKKLGEKWRTSNYSIHTGSIYGLPTKILATLISLFCAFLPVSGFLIWWGRKKKTGRMSGK